MILQMSWSVPERQTEIHESEWSFGLGHREGYIVVIPVTIALVISCR